MTRVNYPPYPGEGSRDDKRENGPSLQEIYAARMRSASADIGRCANKLADATKEAPDLDTATMTPFDQALWDELDRLASNQSNG